MTCSRTVRCCWVAGMLLIASWAVPARGQAAPGGIDVQKYEDQAKALFQQIQDPKTDTQEVMQQFGDLMRQFREETANLPPEQVDQLRQQMMERLQPAMIQAMPMMIRRMQQRVMDQIRKELDCTDEEFAAMKPAIQKVLDAAQAVAIAGMRRGGPGGGPPPGAFGAASPLATAMRELHEVLQDPSAKPDMIKSKVDAVRQAREQANHDLAVARAELRPLLTLRQESALVADGLLD